jgi:hypothetical protein
VEIQLHSAPIRVEFDLLNKKEIEWAKTQYRKAREEKRIIQNENYQNISSFREALGCFLIKEIEVSDDQVSGRIYDETGDRRIIWDFKNPKEIGDAEKLFKEYVINKGYRAYGIDRSGKKDKTKRIYDFNAYLEEIVIDEINVKLKLQDFVRAFSEIQMLPRTRPG